MTTLNFILLNADPSASASAALEAMVLYVGGSMMAVLILYLLFSIVISLFSKTEQKDDKNDKDKDQSFVAGLETKPLSLQHVNTGAA